MESTLIVLGYHPQERKTIVRKIIDYGGEVLKVNLKRQTWSWSIFENIPIGKKRELQSEEPYERGIIGVYRNSFEDISSMISDSNHAVKWLG